MIFASGLKYVGLNTTTLGWVLCAVLLAGAVVWLYYAKPWEREPNPQLDELVAPVDG